MKRIRQGFTLPEVMIAISVSTIVIFGAFIILQVSNNQLQITHAKMSLEEGPREALFKMAQEIRQTAWHKIDTLSAPDASGMERAATINFVVPVPAPDEASLVDANFTPKWAHNICYSLDTTKHQLLRISTDLTTGVKRHAILANEITSLEFSRQSSIPGLITIVVTAQRQISNGNKLLTLTVPMTAQAEARNP